MAISAPSLIAENSAGTPGLWNSVITRLWQNDLSLSGGTFGTSSNTLTPESGNTITVNATALVTQTVTSLTATATPTALAASQSLGFLSTVSGATIMGFGSTFDVTLKNRAGTDVLGVDANATSVTLASKLAMDGIGSFYSTTGITTPRLAVNATQHIYQAGTFASLNIGRINTSFTSPSAVLSGETLGLIAFTGYATTNTTYNATRILGIANENWSSTARGSRLVLQVTPDGATTQQNAMVLNNDSSVAFQGVIAVGNATVSATTALGTPASVAGVSSLRIPHGTAPSSPVDGDVWTTTAGMFVRVNGGTVGPLT